MVNEEDKKVSRILTEYERARNFHDRANIARDQAGQRSIPGQLVQIESAYLLDNSTWH